MWWHDACAIQRQIKAVGIFGRLHLRDGKSSHLGYIPSVLQRAAVVADQYPAWTRPHRCWIVGQPRRPNDTVAIER